MSLHLSDAELNEYLDGTLAGQARAQAEAHLAGCRSCRQRLDALSVLFASLDALPAAPLQRDLSAGVLLAIGATGRPARAIQPLARQPWLFPVVTAQTVAALALLSVAWPYLQNRFMALPWLALARPPTAGLAQLLAQLQAAVSFNAPPLAALAALQSALQSAAAWLPVQPATLAGIAVLAAMLWLFSHLVLLGRPIANRIRRRS